MINNVSILVYGDFVDFLNASLIFFTQINDVVQFRYLLNIQGELI